MPTTSAPCPRGTAGRSGVPSTACTFDSGISVSRPRRARSGIDHLRLVAEAEHGYSVARGQTRPGRPSRIIPPPCRYRTVSSSPRRQRSCCAAPDAGPACSRCERTTTARSSTWPRCPPRPSARAAPMPGLELDLDRQLAFVRRRADAVRRGAGRAAARSGRPVRSVPGQSVVRTAGRRAALRHGSLERARDGCWSSVPGSRRCSSSAPWGMPSPPDPGAHVVVDPYPSPLLAHAPRSLDVQADLGRRSPRRRVRRAGRRGHSVRGHEPRRAAGRGGGAPGARAARRRSGPA